MGETCFWTGPEPAPPGAAAPLASAHPAPLSSGDGGAWSTPADLLRWAEALNTDRLGISGLVQTPGRQARLCRRLANGLFGENLTTEGVDVKGAVIGERWRIGPRLVLQPTATTTSATEPVNGRRKRRALAQSGGG
jgi:hypothetical protein